MIIASFLKEAVWRVIVRLINPVIVAVLLAMSSFPVMAISKADCETQYFIGTGKTADLSFQMCKELMVTQVFRQEFIMNCQRGLVTFTLKKEPKAQYMQLGNDGTPVQCRRS